MRKLAVKDTFATSRIIKKANLMPLFKAASLEVVDGTIANDKAFDFLGEFLSNICDKECETEFYTLIADIAEKTVEEVSLMGLEEFFDMLKQIAKENNLMTFFGSVRKLMK